MLRVPAVASAMLPAYKHSFRADMRVNCMSIPCSHTRKYIATILPETLLRIRLSWMCVVACGIWLSSGVFTKLSAESDIAFEKDIRPILRAHCFHCHGETSENESKLDLRLVRWMLQGGVSGPAVIAGDSEKSLLWQRIESGEMPPTGKGLSDTEKQLVRRWINQGATTSRAEPESLDPNNRWTEEDRDYWAFRTPQRSELPNVQASEQADNAVDLFLLSKLEGLGLTFSPEANRRVLARRLTVDLLGLPPDPLTVEQFESDKSPDAYEKFVERLLASPAYGERWGRHWLDIAGYADSDGYTEKDQVRPWAFRYRDYVIRSLNASKPIDEFIIEQIAGDELVQSPLDQLTDDDVQRLAATGFLRMAPDGSEDGGVDVNVARNDCMAETIKIVSTSLLGLTVGCAQCHDHRYDPISQVDYYRFRAVFEPALDTKNWRTKSARLVNILKPEARDLVAQVEAQLKDLDARQTAELDCIVEQIFDRELEKLPEELQNAAIVARETKADKRTEEQKKLLKEYPSLKVDRGSAYLYEPGRLKEFNERWDKWKAEKRAERPADQAVACLTEVPGKVPQTFVFKRGDCNQPAEAVAPADLSVLTQTKPIPEDDPYVPTTGRRLAWARNLTSGSHPLIGRVLVNRVWMHHFGRGIVNTPGDFGILGERPSHPELLDWLACELVDSGWDLKHLHRLLLLSRAYRQSSQRSDASSERDSENRWLSRMPVRRQEAETLRDNMIAVAGMSTGQMFGAPATVNPDDVGQVIVGSATRDGNGIMVASLKDDPEQYRRSIYVQVRRSMPLGMLEPFDLPTLSPNCDRRTASNVAPQALLLMNNQAVLRFAERFADRVERETGDDATRQARRAMELAWTNVPTEAELSEATAFIQRQREYFAVKQAEKEEQAKVNEASAKKDKNAKKVTEELRSPNSQALALFCQVLLSSNQFLYVE